MARRLGFHKRWMAPLLVIVAFGLAAYERGSTLMEENETARVAQCAGDHCASDAIAPPTPWLATLIELFPGSVEQ